MYLIESKGRSLGAPSIPCIEGLNWPSRRAMAKRKYQKIILQLSDNPIIEKISNKGSCKSPI